MFALFNRFLDLALMRLAPQAFPASGFLFGVAAFAFVVASGLSNFLVSHDVAYALGRTLLSAFNLGVAAAMILVAARRSPRWMQTATALLGGEAVLMIFMLPVLLAYAMEISNVFIAASQWLFLVWELVFIGHVYRNALDAGMGTGIAVALIYVIASAVVKQALIPFPTGQ